MTPPRIELGPRRSQRHGLPLAYGVEFMRPGRLRAFSFSLRGRVCEDHVGFMKPAMVTLAYGVK